MNDPIDPADDDLARRLDNRLGSDAADMAVPGGDVAAVVARGRRRRAALWGGAVGAVALIGLAAWAGADWLLPDPEPSVAVEPLPPVTPTPSASPTPTPTPSPTPTPTPTPTPSPTPTPTPTADPSPSAAATSSPPPTAAPTTEPDPTPEPTTAPPAPVPAPTTPTEPAPTTPSPGPPTATISSGDLVVASTSGVEVRGGDGPQALPGLDGPTTIAFGDGGDGVVFQRNRQGIGHLVDGKVTTLVSLGSFGPRDVDNADTGDAVTLRARGLDLYDVDAASGRMVLGVSYRAGDQAGFDDQVLVVEADLSGGNRREVVFTSAWESSWYQALGGPRWLVNAANEAEGALTVTPRGELGSPVTELSYSFVDGSGPVLSGGQLDDAGSRFATVARSGGSWQVRLYEVGRGTPSATLPVPGEVGPEPVVTDLVGRTVVVSGGRGADARSVAIDLDGGDTRSVSGRATIAR